MKSLILVTLFSATLASADNAAYPLSCFWSVGENQVIFEDEDGQPVYRIERSVESMSPNQCIAFKNDSLNQHDSFREPQQLKLQCVEGYTLSEITAWGQIGYQDNRRLELYKAEALCIEK